jgi:dolichol-phosphate mannosyltransferase
MNPATSLAPEVQSFSAVPDLAIVVPTYKERENVREFMTRIRATLAGLNWELIFVDDDSPDRTADEVRKLAREDSRIRVLQRIGRRGLASACIEGMLASSAPVLAVMDADLQHDESILPAMLDKIENDNAELVVATRNGAGGSKGEFAKRRALISDAGAALGRLVLKAELSDPMSGYFMITSDCFHEVVRNLSGTGFKILVDIVASSKRPLRVAEVPFTFRMRQYGESKLDTKVAFEYLQLLVEKASGGIIPSRFLLFALVGATGVFVHLITLTLCFKRLGLSFLVAQTIATVVAMTSNFWINNNLTFRDSKLKGMRALTGLLIFYVSCSFGGFTNVLIAQYTLKLAFPWLLAGLIGVLVSSVWNYAVNSIFTWKGPRSA